MGLLPISKPTGNAAPEVSAEGAPPAPGEATINSEDGNVSPEEQAEYDEFVGHAMDLMYKDGEEGAAVMPEILEALNVGPPQGAEEGANPAIMALAQTAVTIITKLDDSAREQGRVISDDVLMHGGVEIIEQLGDIAEAANFYDYSEEDMIGAFQQAVDLYRPKLIADGRTTEETLKAQFAELNEADAAGKLGDVLPGLGEATMGEPPVQPA